MKKDTMSELLERVQLEVGNKIDLATALLKFQSECPTLSKEKSTFSYKYLELPSLMSLIRGPLIKNNLLIQQKDIFVGGKSCIMTTVTHTKSGQCDVGISVMPEFEYVEKTRLDKKGNTIVYFVIKGFEDINANLPQAKGAVESYWRRYQTLGILGLVADEDTDAHRMGSYKPEVSSSNKTAWDAAVEWTRKNGINALLESRQLSDSDLILMGKLLSEPKA